MVVSALRPLVKNRNYRELSVREGGVMRYELLDAPVDYTFSEPVLPKTERLSFYARAADGSDRRWLVIEPHRARVMPYYRWNGNSIKWVAAGRRLGTPDFEGGFMGSTVEKSLLHDALFQFSSLEELCRVFDLRRANDAYRTIEGDRPFRLNSVYCGVLERCSSRLWGVRGPADAEVFCKSSLLRP
jgi:hypothetical protein